MLLIQWSAGYPLRIQLSGAPVTHQLEERGQLSGEELCERYNRSIATGLSVTIFRVKVNSERQDASENNTRVDILTILRESENSGENDYEAIEWRHQDGSLR